MAMARISRFRLGVALCALMVPGAAWAQCATTTGADGIVMLTCGDTVTVQSVNTNGNNPSTSAQRQVSANPIVARINAGTTISGFGLLIEGGGTGAISFTNNGIISNTSGTTDQPLAGGLRLFTGGGNLTYLGSGDAITTFTGAPNPGAVGVAGLSLEINGGAGSITLGSASAPVTGTFRGPNAISITSLGSGDINAWINGGRLEATLLSSLNIAGRANINLVMTGNTVMTGSLNIGNFGGGLGPLGKNVATDARIGTAAAPVTNAVRIGVGGTTGGTTIFNLTGTGAIFGRENAILIERSASAPDAIELSTAAGTTINAARTLTFESLAFGINVQGRGSGAITLDLAGNITSGLAGVLVTTGDGPTAITIRAGATVQGDVNALDVRRASGATGATDTLVLGTLVSPNTAATFDGTLRTGNGGTSGTISGNVINDGSLFFNRSDAITYGGLISGVGSLTKQGANTLTLTGASTYTGATTVSSGTLLVNGSLTSAVTVASGARLGGTGSVGATVVNGSLTPGSDGTAGTLTVNGNLVFGAGSIFRVDVGATHLSTDRVLVTGTASLAGGLTAIASGSSFTAGRYTLLTANGGLTGTFNPLTSIPNAPVNLAYDANNVFLDVAAGSTTTFSRSTRESIVFTAPSVVTNRVNNFSTQIVGRLVGGQPLYDQTFSAAFSSTMVQSGLVAARASITAAGGPGVIIGEPVRTASTTTLMTTSASIFSLASNPALTNDTDVTIGPNTVQTGALITCNVASLPSATRPTCQNGGTPFSVVSGSTNVNTNTNTVFSVAENRTDTITETLRETYELNGQVVAVGSVHAEVQSGLFDLGARLLGRLGQVEAGSAGWADVYGFRVIQGGRRSALGIAGGVSIAAAPGLTMALGIDRGRVDVDVLGALETGRVELTEIGASLRYDTGAFSASLALVQGFGNANTRRAIIGNSTARYDVRVTGAAFDMGYALNMGGWSLRPEAGIDWVRLSTDAFTETDSLGLIAGGTTARQVRATAGLSVGRDFGGVTLSARARYLAVLEESARRVPVAFALAPTRALTMTAPGEPDGALVGARIGVPLSKAASFAISYDGRFGGSYTSHAGTATIRVAF
jgi:autotransporter-associated beta strand protein